MLWPLGIGIACRYFSKNKWNGLALFNVIGFVMGMGLVGNAVTELNAANSPEGKRRQWVPVESRIAAGFADGVNERCKKGGIAFQEAPSDPLPGLCDKVSACVSAAYVNSPIVRNELFELWKKGDPDPAGMVEGVALVRSCFEKVNEQVGLGNKSGK